MLIKTLNLTHDQYVSDVADQLPTENGIHLITVLTGGGKTEHMMRHTATDGGMTVFPVKAIKEQQEIANRKLNRSTAIQQIEKLPLVSTDIKIPFNSIHIDEGQILYQGGFRQPVENLINYVNQAAKTRPVYLYSAAVRSELLPVELTTYTKVVKPFERTLNVVQIPTKAEVKNCPVWISTAVDEIIKHTDEIEKDLPVLLFVNSFKMASTVKEHLAKLGHTDSIVLDSKTTSVNEVGKPTHQEQHAVYSSILDNEAIAGCGKRIVITTDVMAEGININDRFIVISCQAESSRVFQQQGRARKFAYHWMITGEGTDRLEVVKGEVWKHTTKDDKPHSYTIRDESKLSETICKWVNSEYAAKAQISSMLSVQFQRGCYGAQVINEMIGYGYQVGDLFGLSEVVKRRVSGVEISKKTVLNAIADHGCPKWFDKHSPLYKALANEYEHELIDRQLTKAIEWYSDWDLMEQQGFKLNVWEIYSRVNALGRSWLQWVFADNTNFESTVEDVSAFKAMICAHIKETSKEVEQTAAGFKGGRVSGEMVEQLSTVFWETVMDAETEYNWFKDENTRMRETLFKLLMGFTVNGDHWSLQSEKPEWCLPLSSAENKAFKRRVPHIESKGLTVETFCVSTGHTTKTIAALKTKEIKTLVSEIQF